MEANLYSDQQYGEVERILESLPYVQWDRYTEDLGEREFVFYGWIDRDKDAYKDFVVLKLWLPMGKEGYGVEVLSFVTSSAKYTNEIHKVLFGDEGGHNDCQRVENRFRANNAIRL